MVESHSRQGYEIGDAAIDNDAVCFERQGAGRFLETRQRDRLVMWLVDRVGQARESYRDALTQIKLEDLIHQDDDLPWFISLAIDAAGMFITHTLATAISRRALPALIKLAGTSSGTNPVPWRIKAEDAILAVTPARVQGVVNGAFTPAKDAGKAALGKTNGEERRNAGGSVQGYIQQLQAGCGAAFEAFAHHAVSVSDDATLVVLYDGLDPALHTTPKYKKELDAKIGRFKASGAADVGYMTRGPGKTRRPIDLEVAESLRKHHPGMTLAEKRVVYVQGITGHRVPWFQNAKTEYEDDAPLRFKTPALDKPVPEEFRQIAVQRSEATWGPTSVVDDGYVRQAKQNGQDIGAMRKSFGAHDVQPTNVMEAVMQAFGHYADDAVDPVDPSGVLRKQPKR